MQSKLAQEYVQLVLTIELIAAEMPIEWLTLNSHSKIRTKFITIYFQHPATAIDCSHAYCYSDFQIN